MPNSKYPLKLKDSHLTLQKIQELLLTSKISYEQNRLMLKKTLASTASAIGYFVTVASVYAQGGLNNPGVSTDIQVEAVPQYIVNALFLIAAFLAVAYLMYGGIKWITSRGDKVQVEAARKHIVAAVLGLVIVAGSFFALNVVFRLLGVENPLEDGFKLKTLEEVNQEIGN